CAITQAGHVFLEPVQLLASQGSKATRLEIGDIYQANEMDPPVVEAAPACTLRPLPVARQIQLAVVREDVMLARHAKDFARLGNLEHLGTGIELLGFRKMGEIPGVDPEVRTPG